LDNHEYIAPVKATAARFNAKSQRYKGRRERKLTLSASMNAGKDEFPHLQFIAGQLEKRLSARKLVEIAMKAAAECEEQAALAFYYRKEVGRSCRAY
jgi:hypothetical protein